MGKLERIRHHDPWLRVIGAFKLVKAALLVTFGIVMLARSHWHELHELVKLVHVDTDHRLAHVVAKIRDLDAARRDEIAIALFCYASLFLVEGFGLIARKVWAEYVTIVITGSFIPLEIYEMIENGSVLKAVVIVFNLAAVGYLLYRLRRDHHWPWREPTT